MSQGPIFAQEKNAKKRKAENIKFVLPQTQESSVITMKSLVPSSLSHLSGPGAFIWYHQGSREEVFTEYSDKCRSLFYISLHRGFHVLFPSSVFNQASSRGLKLIIASKCNFKSKLEKNGQFERLSINRMTSTNG